MGTFFANRTNDDIDKLYKFFNTLAGVSTCQLTIPNSVDGEETVKVVINSYNKSYAYDQFYSLTCEAEEYLKHEMQFIQVTLATTWYKMYRIKQLLVDLLKSLK